MKRQQKGIRNSKILDIIIFFSRIDHKTIFSKFSLILFFTNSSYKTLSILAPKEFPSYVFGMPDIRSIQHGTVKTAEDIMHRKVISCGPNDKIVDILEKMTIHRLRRLPVLEDKKIIGELTLHQLIRKYYNATQYHPITEED